MKKTLNSIGIIEALKARADVDFRLSNLLQAYFGEINTGALIPNFRLIKAEYLPMTNTKPVRLKLSEEPRAQSDKKQSVILPANTGEHLNEYAFKILTENGFNVVSRASTKDAIYFQCNNWAEDYIHLSEIEVMK